ncbi:MAG TPA: hypothetical protein VFI06_08645 [Chitinophagaceae bacterium]|nr:hypothetical protein [Chitinophagaceae bacterium]
MKRIVVLLLIISAFGCTKQHARVENNIQGNWELRKLEGGIGGLIVFQPGNGHIYEFNNDASYRYLDNGIVKETGTYTLQSSTVGGQWTLTLTGPSIQAIQVKIAGQQLIFLKTTNCCDNPDVTFEKI